MKLSINDVFKCIFTLSLVYSLASKCIVKSPLGRATNQLRMVARPISRFYSCLYSLSHTVSSGLSPLCPASCITKLLAGKYGVRWMSSRILSFCSLSCSILRTLNFSMSLLGPCTLSKNFTICERRSASVRDDQFSKARRLRKSNSTFVMWSKTRTTE